VNVLFAGTPEFAARCLEALLASPHQVVGAMTQPDRPAGRGLALAPSPVKKLAEAQGIRVSQPINLREAPAQAELKGFGADVIVVAAYGLILPRPVLELPPQGAINIHASLLPRWRGANPIQRALLAGDRETGVSIMKMDTGLDTGPVLMQEKIPIQEDDTLGTLHDRLAELGAKLVVQALDALETAVVKATPQPVEGATYAAKLDRREARVDWRKTTLAVNRQVRALNPSPGADARVRGVELKIWRCAPATGRGNPGEVLSVGKEGLCVACAEGALLITELQRSGGKRLPVAEFLRGFPLDVGERFEAR
jgi:methionyl-tRNA formyltransferase